MLNFSFQKSETKKRIRAIVLSQAKIFVIISVIIFPFVVYLLTVGHYYKDYECLVNGYSLLVIDVLFVAFIVALHIRIKKGICDTIEKFSEEEKINYTINKIDGQFCIKILNSGKELSFLGEDVKKIYYTKNYIIVKLKSKKIFDLPTNQEILEMLKF